MRVNSGKGFTLVEMIVVISVFAVLAAAAVPSFVDSQRKSQLKVAAQKLLTTLDVAQSESIKTRQRIYVAYVAPDDENRNGCILATNDQTSFSCSNSNVGLPKFYFEHFSGIELKSKPTESEKVLFYFEPQTTLPSTDVTLTMKLTGYESEEAGVLVRRYAGLKGCSNSQFSSWPVCPGSSEES
ncbi:prepilin-type cleavage/methylation domain-containing protein [Veronia nyctiphanis]|uniref:Prepilin-type cleavage/methylation domain-containing protein n=1 Tax=Veronia nyctiphanis TaxID=1278244 RepID=A0A4Q0YRT4_9GAMM|nr:prepilin-type N-terminal cleavage/methylation domain-containing protein [Veronia nyctiphanis]RXJ73852.1 prepilin-type cleavage/methylation domain-containing protein [Veronia nyctiphanis]